MRITKRSVDTLQPDPSRRLYVFDDSLAGFGLVLQPSGVRTYIVEYRPGSGGRRAKKRRVTIGRHGSPWTPDLARNEAKRVLQAVANGADPAAERAAERRGPEAGRSFDAVARRFIQSHGRHLRPSTLKDYRAIIERRLIPAWGERDIDAIQRKDVVEIVADLEDRAPVMGRLVFAVVRSFFGWVVEKGYRDDNPCTGLKGPAAPKSRDRVLDDDELALVWQATFAIGFPFGPAIRLLILTGARRDEVGGLAWSEVDLDRAVWRLPANRTKNDLGHELDFSHLAVAELRTIPKLGPLVFTTTTKGLQGWSRAKTRLDDEIMRLRRNSEADSRKRERLDETDHAIDTTPAWRIHDLRRTAATGMAAAGFAPHVVERVLNHKSGVRGGLVGVYQRHEYRAERKAALLSWANSVERVVNGQIVDTSVLAVDRTAQRSISA